MALEVVSIKSMASEVYELSKTHRRFTFVFSCEHEIVVSRTVVLDTIFMGRVVFLLMVGGL